MRLSQFDARDKIDVRLLPMALQAMPGVTGHYTTLPLTLRLFSLCAPSLCALCVRLWWLKDLWYQLNPLSQIGLRLSNYRCCFRQSPTCMVELACIVYL